MRSVAKWFGLAMLAVLAAVGGLVVFVVSALQGADEPWRPAIGDALAIDAKNREPCDDRSPTRNAYFGDLHVHTAYSWDGSGRGVRTTPDQAYRFARGEPVGLPPFDDADRPLRTVQIERPLDFAAVTDHAESIGEVALCITPGSAPFESDVCRAFRREDSFWGLPKGLSAMPAIRVGTRSAELCGEDLGACRASLVSAWRATGDAAERWYDRSSTCGFTTFHAYEYSYAPGANRVHRNVLFRNEVVPEIPISAIDEPEPEGLWRRLRQTCLDTDGACDVIAIPHNPNHASGRMFRLGDPAEAVEGRRERAQLRADLEPLVEMMQIKGESECRNGLWGVVGKPDELCDFEKYTPLDDEADCEGDVGFGKSLGFGCVSRTDFARYTIAAGLYEESRLGVNPFQVGFIGSTDTHNGTPGDVEEWSFDGSTGLNDADPVKRLAHQANRNPGGLVGVWAEENSRDALFDAMRRRETFATSGPRIRVRLFAGWDGFGGEAGTSWCDRDDSLEAAYATGVPMGSVLSAREDSEAPSFAVFAARDPGTRAHPGGLLERIQIIKVWADADGDFHDEVFDVAGGPTGADVDPATCAPRGPGANTLCAEWRDPNFDPSVAAAYYARVVENPSCRWTTWLCLALDADDRPATCATPELIRERAWSSPIWYGPASAGRVSIGPDRHDRASVGRVDPRG